MEPFLKEHDKVKGIEVLFFDNAEIEKVKGSSPSFASAGPLSVLYFKDYNRFVLHLNDWRYPLMRRLPVTSEKSEGDWRVYEFPALNGFSYRLRINSSSSNALSNFDAILGNFSSFSMKGVESLPRKLEASPDDKLYRHEKSKGTGPTEMIKGVIRQSLEKVKHATGTLKVGSAKKLTSRSKKMDLKTIRNKNFRKDAKSTFKKDFFSHGQKLSQEFLDKRRNNANLSQSREFKDLMKTNESCAPVLYLWIVELEEAILNNKDLINQGGYKLTEEQHIEKKGIMQSLKQGISDIRGSMTGLLHHGQEARGRDMKPSTMESEPKTEIESEHYQG